MYVYRLEDSDGNGPYHASSTIEAYLHRHNDPTEQHMLDSIKHTRKQFDGLSEYIYSWGTKKKALKFIRSYWRDEVTKLGWRIKRFKVNKHSTIRFHDGQVLFKRTVVDIVYDARGNSLG